MSDFIGDPTCKYNALSEHIRCSVRPFGPCDGCLDYVKVREYVPSVSIKPIAPLSNQEPFDYRLKVTLLRVWCFLSTPLELLQITCLLTFVSLVFFDVLVFSDQYLLQEFQRHLRYVAHLYVIYRIAICFKDLLQYDYRRKTFWETFSYLVCPLMWWIIFDAAIEIFGE